MTKKEFQKLIRENKGIFRCLILSDATLWGFNPHTAIKICWNAHNNAKTTVKTMRGRQTDPKCIDALEKYKRWANEVTN